MFKVDKEKCIGCATCATMCPNGAKMNDDGKAEIIDSEALEKCGGETLCPVNAIVRAEQEN